MPRAFETYAIGEPFDVAKVDSALLGELCDHSSACAVSISLPLADQGEAWFTVTTADGTRRTDLHGRPAG